MSALTDVGKALEQFAPTVAGLFLGPLGSLGVTEAEKIFGLTPSAGASLTDRAMALSGALAAATPEQVIAMKQADDVLKQKFADAGIQLAQIDQEDRASARSMQTATRTWITPALAVLVVGAAIIGESYAMTHTIPAGAEIIVGRVLGTLDAALMMVLSFYFGSSQGSADKNALISKALDSTPPAN